MTVIFLHPFEKMCNNNPAAQWTVVVKHARAILDFALYQMRQQKFSDHLSVPNCQFVNTKQLIKWDNEPANYHSRPPAY